MIEKANINDLYEIVNIMDDIKQEMRDEHNPQWGSTEEDYPSIDRIKEDIKTNNLYKYVDDNRIKGVISIMEDTKEYDEVIENSHKKAYIIHRLAIPQMYRKNNIATKLMEYALNKAKEEGIEILKSDTEVSNDKMNRLFIKLGYIYKGQFVYDDYPGKYNYYEKEV